MLKSTLRLFTQSSTVAIVLLLGGCHFDSGPTVITDSELSDQSDLSVRVKRALKIAPQTASSNITVSTVGHDTVELNGFVLNAATSYEAERVAGQVSGVRHVFNALIIQ